MTLIKFQNENASRKPVVFPPFNDLWGDMFDGMITRDFKRWSTPSVNIKESDSTYTLELAAPGLAKEDFKIRIDENQLTIWAEKKQELNEKTEKYSRKEFSFTSFTRSFMLPENVNIEGIQANYTNGIMMIVIPKSIPAKTKTKEIQID